MGKFDERALRMRKERIDLFGDKAVTVVISRPERRALTYREAIPAVEEQIATTKPPMPCFDPACGKEVHALGVFMMVVTDPHPNAQPVAMAACASCSTKSNEEILKIMRADLTRHGLNPVEQAATATADLEYGGAGAPFDEYATERTVAGIRLAVVGNFPECRPAMAFAMMLEARKLPMFALMFRGHNNCYVVVSKLYRDLKTLGIADKFEWREGHCPIIQSNGEPIGLHRWVEADGWIIDASGGAFGNPVVFQRADDYYRKRQMTDIRDVLAELTAQGDTATDVA
jgi:hypothetical protein